MTRMENLAILASAGTGKTFSLAMRFILLMHAGVPPSAIVAVTFTNKAAGEILEKITSELAAMSGNPALLRERIESGLLPADMTSPRARALLRKLLLCRERLQIGTIDSFFLNIVQAFPLECGVAGSVSMIDESDERPRQTALLRMIRESAASGNELRELREAVKQASFGAEERSLRAAADQFIGKEYPRYLANPDAHLWGNPVPVWPDFDKNFILSEKNIREMIPAYAEKVNAAAFPPALAEKFNALPEAALENIRKRRINKSAADLIARLSAASENSLLSGEIPPDGLTLPCNRKKYTVPAALLREALLLIRHLTACEFARVILRTQAVFKLLERFNTVYARENRAKGLLTFQDIPYLLGGGAGLSGPGEPVIGSSAVLEERTDARTDHYLLDEFQDTSDIQWERLENLIDEAVQESNPERKRSFFYVGDVKQSIYQWREGNPRLFGMVARRYAPEKFGPRGVQVRSLNRSFRSGPGVLEAVNRVFETNLSAVPNDSVLQAVKDMKFEHHTSAPSAARRRGCTLAFETKEKDPESRAAAIYSLIRSLRPFQEEKPLSVGVLVRRNDTAGALAESFRRFNRIFSERGEAPLPVTVDGKLLAGESMACVLFLQLLNAAAHPGDRRAGEYLAMLQFGNKYLDWNKFTAFLTGDTPAAPLPRTVRDFIHENGFAAFARRFLEFLREKTGGGENGDAPALSGFDFSRLQICLDAAREADSAGELSIDGFLKRFQGMERRESSVRNTVQIMTVHKAKGLDFDVVVMTGFSGRDGMDSLPASTVAIAKDEEFRTRWISFQPAGVYADLIPGFRECRREKAQSSCYENCCAVYVGMTRARRGLYLFLDPRPAAGKAYRADDLLRDTLRDPESLKSESFRMLWTRIPPDLSEKIRPLACIGDPLWREKTPAPEEKTKETPSPAGEAAAKEREFLKNLMKNSAAREEYIARSFARTHAMTPSGAGSAEHFSKSAAFVSAPQTAGAGTLVHEILSRFEWYESPEETELFLQKELSGSGDSGEAVRLLRNAFLSEDVRRSLARPANAPSYSLWREQRFLAPGSGGEPGAFFSGCFDRVTLVSDLSGKPLRAEVLDYKTDRLKDPEAFLARHSRQLNLYRKVLAGMLNLPESAVSCVILALRPGLAIPVLPAENPEE